MPKPTVLCVDDQAPNLRIRAMMLEQFGCTAVTAADHRGALHAMAENSVDIVVIDYHLAGGETGEEVARDIRVMFPHVPMIMLTGDSSLPKTAIESVNAVLFKGSASPSALLDLIQELLPDSALRPRRPMLVSNPRQQDEPKGNKGSKGKAS